MVSIAVPVVITTLAKRAESQVVFLDAWTDRSSTLKSRLAEVTVKVLLAGIVADRWLVCTVIELAVEPDKMVKLTSGLLRSTVTSAL